MNNYMFNNISKLVQSLNIPKLYETEELKSDEKIVKLKFHDIAGTWEWYVVEVEIENNDILFFGYVNGHYPELGYFRISEFESVNKKFPCIQLELNFKEKNLAEIKRELEKEKD